MDWLTGERRGLSLPAVPPRRARPLAGGVARFLLVRRAHPAAVIEVELVADHQAAAARRLHVAPVPIALLLGDGDEWPAVGPVPVETVAAEADAHLVGLWAARRNVLVA